MFIKKNDYQIVENWWNERNQAPAPENFLSDYGVIVHDGEIPIAALWMYPIVSAKFSLILSPITNPETTKEQRDEALNLSMDMIHSISKELGFTHTLCLSNVEAFQNRLRSFGYSEGDKDCIHFWGGL